MSMHFLLVVWSFVLIFFVVVHSMHVTKLFHKAYKISDRTYWENYKLIDYFYNCICTLWIYKIRRQNRWKVGWLLFSFEPRMYREWKRKMQFICHEIYGDDKCIYIYWTRGRQKEGRWNEVDIYSFFFMCTVDMREQTTDIWWSTWLIQSSGHWYTDSDVKLLFSNNKANNGFSYLLL